MDGHRFEFRKRPSKSSVTPYAKVPKPEKTAPEKTVKEAGKSKPGSSGLTIEGKENLFGGNKLSLLKCLQRSREGENVNSDFSMIRKAALVDQISRFNVLQASCPFYRRVTSITWHSTNPNIVATASKGGEISWYNLRSRVALGLHGIGPGGSITGMKINRETPNVIYTASLEGAVKKIDLEKKEETVLLCTKNFDEWYCSLDFCPDRNLILTGDTSGYVYALKPEEDNDGLKTRKRFHKSKVTHIEFCPRDPNIIVTASIDHSVKLWDFRMLRSSSTSSKLMEPLIVFPHEKGVNSAYFNPNDRFSLLTTDQHSDIRIYRSPVWDDKFIIKHPHRQFQHLTPIKATWHPLEDLFIVGRYPDDSIKKNDERTVDIYDGKSGQRLHAFPSQGISTLNAFNCTGDAFVSCTGSSFMIWKDENMMPMFEQT